MSRPHLTLLRIFVVSASLFLAACGGAPTTSEPPRTEATAAANPASSDNQSTPTEPAEAAAPAEPTTSDTTAAEPTTAIETAAAGGTVIIGLPQEPPSLNPLLASSTIEDAVSSFVVEGLVQIDADGKYAPVLAQELPEVSDDGLTLTYHLREDIKFSNGDPFTCADVQFTHKAILSDLSGASTSGYSDITSVECPDEHTAVVTFEKVYAPYLRLFSYIIPQSAGDVAKLDTWEFNRTPIGTGPWVVSEWQASDHITLVKNPNYREPGKPQLDSIILKIVPSREIGVQLLGTGEIDGLWNLVEADFAQLDTMKDQGVTYAAAVTGENELLVLNLADPSQDAPADPAQAPHPILGDLRVRQAIQLGIDKALLVEALLYDRVKVGTTVLPAGPFACPQEPSQYDPQAATALLEEAGWTVGSDGIREKGGQRLSLKIQTTAGEKLREDTEQALVEMMKEIGLELTIENVPSDVLFAGWDDQGLRKHGNFDILLYTTGSSIDPASHLYNNYHSGSIPTAENEGAGANYSRYINEVVDTNIDTGDTSTDTEERREAYCKVAEQINQDLPRIFLYERLSITGYRDRIQNFRVSPGPSDFTVGSENWSIKP